MMNDILKGKKVLVVDDEPDVSEAIAELLFMCDVTQVATYNDGKKLLEMGAFDIAILDIMGVQGYKLLDVANDIGIPAVMLTAHAFSVEDTVKSFKSGAVYFVPKEEMSNIAQILSEIFETLDKAENVFERWLDRFAAFYDTRFGPDWREKDEKFWSKYKYWM
ncbi:Response regulator receiver domain protein [uncultured Desulfatiglans sp.]|nr:Response regulator receiver domain protein [uncultured Desulfatiglans sp.]